MTRSSGAAVAATASTEADVLRLGYRKAAAITRRFGTTYYWGVQLLAPRQRRHVYAVYALCRLADDIVDAPGATRGDVSATSAALQAFQERFNAALRTGHSPYPVLAAAAHTARTRGVEGSCFDRFFGAMRQDLTTARYETWADLCGYMDGSAAVIGEMMLPVLEPNSPAAVEPARALGMAFQLTNFLRDVGEDLDRGRIYLPMAEMRAVGADATLRRVNQPWREFMRFQIARNRELYVAAGEGLSYLPPPSARCVAAARQLYARILNEIEASDYDVFTRRARVSTWRKLGTLGRLTLSARRTGFKVV